MKGIDVRKLAVVAGMGLLGISTVFGAVKYSDTTVVNDNGQPVAKVVVGSKAAISDGIVAANIAARLANEAYKASTLTAGTTGDATCSVPNVAAGQQGSCALLDESVTLVVTVPGVAAGQYDISTYINDYVDRYVKNRINTNAEDKYSETTSDTSTEINSLSRAKNGIGTSAGVDVLRVTGNDFSPLKTDTIQDTKSALTSNTYTEEQYVWLRAQNQYSTSNTRLEGRVNDFGYAIRFTNDDYGIPQCTTVNPSDGDYALCNATDSDATANHRMRIWFLGDKWVVTGMAAPTGSAGNVSTSTGFAFGGSLRLAKESNYKIISVGEVIDAGEVKVRLADISVAEGADNSHPAIVDILDANNNLLSQTKISVGSTFSYKTPSNKVVKIYIYKTAAGVTLAAKWAEISVLSNEIILQDGQTIDSDANLRYRVKLGWKNRNIPSSYSSVTNAQQADALREIVIYYDYDVPTMAVGDSLGLIGSPKTFTLTFAGSDLTDADKDSLQFRLVTNPGVTVANLSGSYSGPEGNTTIINTDCTNRQVWNNTLVLMTSSSATFDLGSSGSANSIYLDPKTGVIYAKTTSSATCYAAFGRNAITGADTGRTFVKYRTAGDIVSGATTEGTPITTGAVEFMSNLTPTADNFTFGSSGNIQVDIYEDVGRINTTVNGLGNLSFNISGAADFNSSVQILPSSTTVDRVRYGVTPNSGVILYGTNQNASYTSPFLTLRGSEYRGQGSDSASFKIAKRVARVKWTLATQATTTSFGDTYTLKEGATQALSNGVTIQVKSIDEKLGACTASGNASAPTCTVDSSAVKAVILPANAAQVTASQPYKLTDSLVMLDSNAGSAGVVISVGGPVVNTVTANALQGSSVDFATQNVVVKKVGNVIVVAGQSAANTQTAGDQFLSELVRS